MPGSCSDPRYLHEGGRPVVQIWGFYRNNPSNLITAEVAGKLIDFFKAPGPYSAYLVGGGDWNWRRNPDPAWQAFLKRFDAYSPWNVGNYSIDEAGVKHAATSYWADDKQDCERQGHALAAGRLPRLQLGQSPAAAAGQIQHSP